MIQPAVIGGCFWLLAWCVILCYILGLNKKPKQTQETEPLTREKLVANATKVVVALFALLPTPIFAQIFELWTETYGNTSQSLDLLRTVSNIVVTLALGGITAYISYRQYQISRALWEIEAWKDTQEMMKRVSRGESWY